MSSLQSVGSTEALKRSSTSLLLKQQRYRLMKHVRPELGFLALFLFLNPSQTTISRAAEEPATQAAPRPSDNDLRRSDWIAEGRAKFVSVCAYCHGSKGNAGKVKSFTERSNWDPQFIHDTIVNGRTRGANVMPPWGGSIPDDLIWKIVSYIKSLSVDFKGPIDQK